MELRVTVLDGVPTSASDLPHFRSLTLTSTARQLLQARGSASKGVPLRCMARQTELTPLHGIALPAGVVQLPTNTPG